MTTLTLTDAAGTPVNRSFPLSQQSPDLAIWKDYTTNGGYPAGAGVASASLKESVDGTIRCSLKLVLPIMETLGTETALGFAPAPTVAFKTLWANEMVFPARSSLQHRKDLHAMGKDFLNDAVVTAMVENLTHPS